MTNDKLFCNGIAMLMATLLATVDAAIGTDCNSLSKLSCSVGAELGLPILGLWRGEPGRWKCGVL